MILRNIPRSKPKATQIKGDPLLIEAQILCQGLCTPLPCRQQRAGGPAPTPANHTAPAENRGAATTEATGPRPAAERADGAPPGLALCRLLRAEGHVGSRATRTLGWAATPLGADPVGLSPPVSPQHPPRA